MIVKVLILGGVLTLPQDWVPVYDPDFISRDCEELGADTWVAYDWADDPYAFQYGYGSNKGNW